MYQERGLFQFGTPTMRGIVRHQMLRHPKKHKPRVAPACVPTPVKSSLVRVAGINEGVHVLVQFVVRLLIDVDHVAGLVIGEADVLTNRWLETYV